MIINEDYFDDIEIEDIDIDDNDEISLTTTKEIYDFYQKTYTQTIIIDFDNNVVSFKNLPKYLSSLHNSMSYLFNIYGIEHSEMCVIDNDLLEDIDINDMAMLNCKDYMLVIPKDTQTPVPFKKYRYLAYYVKFPNMHYKNAINFTMRLFNNVWDQKRYKNVFNSIMFTKCVYLPREFWFPNIPSVERQAFYRAFHTKDISTLNIDDLANWDYFTSVIKYFFGERTAQKMYDRLEMKMNPFEI